MSNERDGTVGEVIDQRVQVYGDPTETFVRIAEVWSGILGHTVNATDVPLCLIGMKLVRTTQAPDYSDNSDDVEGYLDIFRQLVGEDMIHARSVKEYVEMKAERERHPLITDYVIDEPIPYQLQMLRPEERAQHLRRAATVTDQPPAPDMGSGHVEGCTLSDDHIGTCCICRPGSSTCKVGCPSRGRL